MDEDHLDLDRRLAAIFRDIVGEEPAVLTDDMTPDDIPQWDSLNHINLMLAVEEEFGVSIPMPDYAQLVSVGSIRRRVRESLQDGVAHGGGR